MKWSPSLGAYPAESGTGFGVWAPNAKAVEVVTEAGAWRLEKSDGGVFHGTVAEIGTGDRYRYRVDGEGPYPDPASRFQPQGVHEASQVIDPRVFRWSDGDWRGIDLEELVLYELHTGTFTPEGTFRAAMERLPYLRELGVTGVELMPVADFPGRWNWGYDGVALFAPARCYGTPDELRAFVDEAHRLGLAVFLDVVYNHLGPDGAYSVVLSPYFFSERHRSPWGAGINLDGEHSEKVRGFFIENALHWIHDYHFDGLRLDATHAMVDDGPRHFLAELTGTVRASLASSNRKVLLIAEDVRNLAHMVKPESEGGWGLDGVWADDFHHEVRVHLAGDSDGYYQDFQGTLDDIATTVRKGWYFQGQHSRYLGRPRGSDPAGIARRRFVICNQNHDQVGNRPFGDRLHHQIDLAAYRAAVVLLLLAPETPLLFMGQEWAATTPFQYFTNHNEELGRLVSEGRKSEFQGFSGFAGEIPDPQDAGTFEASKLVWDELDREPHAGVLRLHRELLQLRSQLAADGFQIATVDGVIVLRRRLKTGAALLAVIRTKGAGRCDLSSHEIRHNSGETWATVMSTEDIGLVSEPKSPQVENEGPRVTFERPGAVILRGPMEHREGGD